MLVDISEVDDLKTVEIYGVRALRVMIETFYSRYSLTDGKMPVDEVEIYVNDLLIKATAVEAAIGRLVSKRL